MRIIFAELILTAGLLLTAIPAPASDLEYPPERIKTYRSYEKCLAALKAKHVEARTTEQSSSEDTPDGTRTQSTHVTGIYYGGPKQASFTISQRTALQPRPGGPDGHSFGSGIDWSCDGRVMWKGGGHSAYMPIPAAPLPPEPPPPPSSPATP